jgi:hypothetical protein
MILHDCSNLLPAHCREFDGGKYGNQNILSGMAVTVRRPVVRRSPPGPVPPTAVRDGPQGARTKRVWRRNREWRRQRRGWRRPLKPQIIMQPARRMFLHDEISALVPDSRTYRLWSPGEVALSSIFFEWLLRPDVCAFCLADRHGWSPMSTLVCFVTPGAVCRRARARARKRPPASSTQAGR